MTGCHGCTYISVLRQQDLVLTLDSGMPASCIGSVRMVQLRTDKYVSQQSSAQQHFRWRKARIAYYY